MPMESSSSFPPPPKRHHSFHQHPTPSTPPPPPPTVIPTPPKFSSGSETVFRILCPATKTGAVIGRGGSTVRHLREETGARIRVVDESLPPHCDERVILITAAASSSSSNSSAANNYDGECEIDGRLVAASPSPAQTALVRVLERILRADDERSDKGGEDHRRREEGAVGGEDFGVCRLLAPSHQVGCVLGRGGKIVEWIRQESGAQIRVYPREHIPACASPGDELIQITGGTQAVKKALLLVSGCLQDHPRGDEPVLHRANSSTSHAMDRMDYPLRSYAPENVGPNHRIRPDEEVVFRILCHIDKVGSLIGKGGSVVHAIENDTGASVKSTDVVLPDSEERVVVISAHEQWDMQRSPAQDAVIRVHGRIAELGFEPGAPVVARLLVHSQQIGCLLGKGGHVVAEMRRLTGASIRMFGRDQGFKYGNHGDEVVQIVGSMQSVKDALFQITSRLREIVFRGRVHPYCGSAPSTLPSFPELPSPHFRPRPDTSSPVHYPSPAAGLHHHNHHHPGFDKRSAGQTPFHHHSTTHGTDRNAGSSSNQVAHHYGNDESSPYGPFDRLSSPKMWNSQVASTGAISSGYVDVGRDVVSESGGQNCLTRSVEVVVPQMYLFHVYGENNANLVQIRQVSGADVVVHDPKPGSSEGTVVISGTLKQLHFAQSLVQAFIFCGLPF